MTRAARRVAWIALLAVVVATAGYLAREAALTRMGAQLVRVDPLSRVDAVIPLGGGTPLRDMEAADLYLAGYAPRVVLAMEREAPAADRLRARGVPFETPIGIRTRIIRSLGVPDSAITVLDRRPANSTRAEAELVREWVASSGATRIIIVTSTYHTARSSLLFRRMLRDRGVVVLTRSAPTDPFRPGDWWKDRDELRNGLFEWQKLVFYYLAYR